MNYVDNFVGFGTPSNAKMAYEQLYKIIEDLGLTISQKKLVPPSTKGIIHRHKRGHCFHPSRKNHPYK